jgi:ribonuclease D
VYRLIDVLVAGNRPWVLHSARQDFEVLFYRFGKLPAQLIDTQLAASLLGHPLQLGLQGLVSDVIGISLDKEHTRTDWSRRPLPEAALHYALDDVRYLLPAWQTLRDGLERSGRFDWFQEDCARLLGTPIRADASAILERTKGSGSLRGRHRAAALALVGWREDRAMQRNKPRRWILADDQLVAIAAVLPQSLAALARVPGLPNRLVANSGQAILQSIEAAPEIADAPDPAPPDRRLVKTLRSEIKALAKELGIQPELLATRKDIALAASGRLTATFTSGWRASVLAPVAARLSSDQAS